MYSGHTGNGSYDKTVYDGTNYVPLQPTAPPICNGSAFIGIKLYPVQSSSSYGYDMQRPQLFNVPQPQESQMPQITTKQSPMPQPFGEPCLQQTIPMPQPSVMPMPQPLVMPMPQPQLVANNVQPPSYESITRDTVMPSREGNSKSKALQNLIRIEEIQTSLLNRESHKYKLKGTNLAQITPGNNLQNIPEMMQIEREILDLEYNLKNAKDNLNKPQSTARTFLSKIRNSKRKLHYDGMSCFCCCSPEKVIRRDLCYSKPKIHVEGMCNGVIIRADVCSNLTEHDEWMNGGQKIATEGLGVSSKIYLTGFCSNLIIDAEGMLNKPKIHLKGLYLYPEINIEGAGVKVKLFVEGMFHRPNISVQGLNCTLEVNVKGIFNKPIIKCEGLFCSSSINVNGVFSS